MEAIGDVAHLERFGYAPIGNVLNESISDIVANLDKIGRRVTKAHLKIKQCVSCENSPICAGTGFHVVNNVFSQKGMLGDGECPHFANKLIEHFKKQVVEV